MEINLLILSVLVLGFRHGIDWDHIAAISDIVSTSKSRKLAVSNGLVYVLAHAVVVIFLGLLAIILGVSLPSWVDQIMGPIVGLSLIILGLWIILAIIIKKGEFKFMSRWMMIIKGTLHVYNHLIGKPNHHPVKYPQNMGIKTAYLIGTIHGIGAETPTQVLLFVTAAGVGGGLKGSILLLVFVIGLLISNLILVLLSLLGLIHAKKYSKIFSVLGIMAGVMSLIVGTLFLKGQI